jgi:glucosamine--fructose-6-phosphate aminotransferase (isomerizing)
MLDEIRQQPAALEKTLTRELRAIEKLRAFLERHRPRMVVLAARGTSDNAAQFGRYLIEITTGIPVSLAAPSVHTLYQARMDLTGALVAGVSQSGESTDVNIVVENAKRQGAFTIGVTNEEGSALAALADHVLLVRAGKEKSVAATKTYTGQLAAMYLLAWALGANFRLAALERIPAFAARALAVEKTVAEQCRRYHFMQRAVVIARGLNYANAFEMALKLMETCYVVAERFSSADLLHGPIAMIDSALPAFAFAPEGVTADAISQTVARLREIHSETLIIGDRSSPLETDIQIPVKLTELFTPIPYIIPAQLFAAHLAAEKGLNPDQPRSLTKVTRTI